MSNSVIVAIIAGTMSLAGTIITVIASNIIQTKKNAIKEVERETRQAMRLDNIEKKLDIHNGYAEKIGDIQKDIAVMKNDIEYIKGDK